jgi:hypothetical protein
LLPLLDHLAVTYRESGWNTKRLHREILDSATYRQSSRMTEAHRRIDPENRWLARSGRFRMPSMIVRDWALASAQLLDRRIGGAPVYPYQPDGIWESLAITKERDFTYPASSGADLYRRSLYTFWRRTVGPANMFDTSNRQACRVRQVQTSTPLHALTTLNDPTWVEASRRLAEHCMRSSSAPRDQIRIAFRAILTREPQEREMDLLEIAYDKQKKLCEADTAAAEQLLSTGTLPRDPSLEPVALAALGNVVMTLLNLDEALTRE